ncbi:MAG: ABC transporter permease, partial [Gaiellaceae bacterium]
LSGGQRKRVSVALELLTEPSLLFLDEPTSGLDPNYERSLMELFRRLADNGRTVVVVTHSVESLHLCDRVLILAPGGRVAYYGPPQFMTAYFGVEDMQDVFRTLVEQPAVDWATRYREHAFHRDYVLRGSATEPPAQQTEGPRAPTDGASRLRSRGWWSQFSTLTRRYAALTVADRANLTLLVAQAPVLGLLLLLALPTGELGSSAPGEFRLLSQASLVLLVVILGVTWLGMSNAVREIAKEMPIFRRERAAGVAISAYVASKAVVLGLITCAQAAVLVTLALLRQGGPDSAVLFGWPLGELLVVGAMTGVAAMAAGLFVSAVARTPDRATTLLPIVLVVLLVLALGGVVREIGERPGLKQLGYVAISQWGFSAAASTSSLNDLQAVTGVLTRVPSVDIENPTRLFDALGEGERGDARWDHNPSAWLRDVGALFLLTIAGLVGTCLALRREGAGRRVR